MICTSYVLKLFRAHYNDRRSTQQPQQHYLNLKIWPTLPILPSAKYKAVGDFVLVLALDEYTLFFKQHFHKQHQAETEKISSKS